MNYRHAFHAGNFADLVKHAAVLQLLARRDPAAGPLTVIDTHAGRGLYDLGGSEALRSGEARAGVARLMAADGPPAEFAALVEAVRRLNGGGEVRRYPGSPWLIAENLRPKDHYIACELRAEEHQALKTAMGARRHVETVCADGYGVAAARTPAKGDVLVLIDPPFERPDDYRRIVETVSAVRARNAGAKLLIWLPLKDLETFDGFLRDLEDESGAACLVAETRLRPLTDPMKMNGCALVLVDDAVEMLPVLEAICGWTAAALGENGAARTYRLPSR
ncbi:23S rRNA (adenine(2030)-N(6))-methyltransferase RlmJ [Phenylobacterium deserti]|uniref:Ribosomal RNA large subunit methyltransferase J n=1 Tax=Phenylobacterium deserti TaxID=1914756 RepID=A0A328A807_9CAUL|nr:23S rRNA (adenine(2030)-N(6))-methyltransferase RlmJ [Phenylobacterium deserti]RAK50693.1 23S rRNA (adenine(2030)-N(6))-methyltransferase RlmJ [Phenylobacterium deserti]